MVPLTIWPFFFFLFILFLFWRGSYCWVFSESLRWGLHWSQLWNCLCVCARTCLCKSTCVGMCVSCRRSSREVCGVTAASSKAWFRMQSGTPATPEAHAHTLWREHTYKHTQAGISRLMMYCPSQWILSSQCPSSRRRRMQLLYLLWDI